LSKKEIFRQAEAIHRADEEEQTIRHTEIRRAALRDAEAERLFRRYVPKRLLSARLIAIRRDRAPSLQYRTTDSDVLNNTEDTKALSSFADDVDKPLMNIGVLPAALVFSQMELHLADSPPA